MRIHCLKAIAVALLLASACWAQEIRRPTAEANYTTAFGICAGTNLASTAMANYYDASGESTSATQSALATTTTDRWKGRVFTTWQAASGSYSVLNLKVFSACSSAGLGGGDCDAAYSTNGGTSWTPLAILNPASISLSASQNLSQLQVRVCAVGFFDATDPGTGTLTGYDIRTEGTLVPKGAKKGAVAAR